jgi:hypothetical protein
MPVFFIHAGIMAKNVPVLEAKNATDAVQRACSVSALPRSVINQNEKATVLSRSGL